MLLWEPPRAIPLNDKINDSNAALGLCDGTGSGDGGQWLNHGNNAGGDCQLSGFGASGSCTATGHGF